MLCINCKTELENSNTYPNDPRYCLDCGQKHAEYIKDRRLTLQVYRDQSLASKIAQTRMLIQQAINEFGIDKVYISYSGGKDSTVLSHIAKSINPNITHIFANTTNEYPETIKHILWEKEHNGTNLIIVTPVDSNGRTWTFKDVVNYYGYPVFSKRVSNAIRTYQHAKTERTRLNSLEYMYRNFKKYIKYKDLPISDKCCEKLKKDPIRRKAKELGMECAILGILASESYQREKDWLEYGCNVFHVRRDNQSRPLSFWTDADIIEYIEKYNVKIPELYKKGYTRNGCMFCGFGVHLEEIGQNRFQKLKNTHPVQYHYLVTNFGNLLTSFDIDFT